MPQSQLPLAARKKQRGGTLVEGALIFTLASALLIGVIDLGQMLFVHQTVVDRVRVAARWASVNPYDSSQITNMVLYGTPAAGTSGTELFGMTSSNVVATHDTSDGAYADRITINVSGYTYLMFSGTIVNTLYSLGGGANGSGGGPSVVRTGLTVNTTVPHEYVP